MHRLPVILFFSTIFQGTAAFTWAGPMDALSEREAARGLRDALVLAAEKAVSRLGQENGFLRNEGVAFRCPMVWNGLTVHCAGSAWGTTRMN